MEIRRFDRHENMSSETLSKILNIIGDLVDIEAPTRHLENMLYGFFDGYDYTEQIIFSKDLADVTHENPSLGAKISEICGIIESYPTLQAA